MTYDNNDEPIFSVLNGKTYCGFHERYCDRYGTGDPEDPYVYAWMDGFSDPNRDTSACNGCPNSYYSVWSETAENCNENTHTTSYNIMYYCI